MSGNSASTEFFIGFWVKFDTYTISRQFGISLDQSSGYVYWETIANGAIRIRHNGGTASDSGTTDLDDGGWQHVALSATSGT